ncbi:gustatory receptor for bitter taste 66a-like [Adelges cooleyi]|uniref:gustatory receptor for bitter taste 66a-like n=1 Tax=Adelges cooleyi TaxID=133065 RepID=UPI0021800BFD|nr:gustatory receptor for bitter taste 66a-like [Adelges cooleyi]
MFVSYRAERLKRVAEDLVKISLRNVLASGDMNDISNIILINAFTNQIVNRNINMSACGFFSVNLSFFHGLIRLATTYLIVVIQYSSKAPK